MCGSVSGAPWPWWKRALVGGSAFVGLFSLLIGILIGVDGLRLLPCLKSDSRCIELAMTEFTDICSFEHLPYR
jgi:hypothetical protein